MPDAIDDLFRRFGKAFNKADAEEIAACVTDDFEWRLNAGGFAGRRVCSRARTGCALYFGDKSKAHREARYLGGAHPSRRGPRCSAPSASPEFITPASRSTATVSTSMK